jgi:hypothetical protein
MTKKTKPTETPTANTKIAWSKGALPADAGMIN